MMEFMLEMTYRQTDRQMRQFGISGGLCRWNTGGGELFFLMIPQLGGIQFRELSNVWCKNYKTRRRTPQDYHAWSGWKVTIDVLCCYPW